MSTGASTALFLILWVITVAYVLSGARLEFAVRAMQRQGRLLDAPRIFHPLDGFRAIGWLLGGHYAKVGDEVVARWAGITRILFFIVMPPFLLIGLVSLVAILA